MIKNTIKRSLLCAAIVSTMGVNVAHAFGEKIYVGLDAGKAEAKKYCNNIANCDSSDASLRGEVGFQLNPNFAAELGYTSFGTLFKGEDNNVNAKQEANAWTVSALGAFPIAERFSLFGRLGMVKYDVTNTGVIQGVAVKNDNTIKPYFGLGGNFDMTENWTARAEFQLYTDISGVDGSKDNVNAWYLGGVYKF